MFSWTRRSALRQYVLKRCTVVSDKLVCPADTDTGSCFAMLFLVLSSVFDTVGHQTWIDKFVEPELTSVSFSYWPLAAFFHLQVSFTQRDQLSERVPHLDQAWFCTGFLPVTAEFFSVQAQGLYEARRHHCDHNRCSINKDDLNWLSRNTDGAGCCCSATCWRTPECCRGLGSHLYCQKVAEEEEAAPWAFLTVRWCCVF